MNNKTYPFYRLLLPNFIITLLFYMVIIIHSPIEILLWLILGCLIPLVIMALLCAKYRLLKHRSSVRSLLKIVFFINIPSFGVAVYVLFVEWRNPTVWLFVGGFFILGCSKDFALTYVFLPKKSYPQIIQKRYPILLILIVSVLVLFITPAPDYPKRTYVSEGLGLASSVKIASATFYDEHKRFPKNNEEASLARPTEITGNAVKSIAIKPTGVIKITYNEKLKDNAILTIKVVVEQDKITWICVKNKDSEITLLPKDLPAGCRKQIYGEMK